MIIDKNKFKKDDLDFYNKLIDIWDDENFILGMFMSTKKKEDRAKIKEAINEHPNITSDELTLYTSLLLGDNYDVDELLKEGEGYSSLYEYVHEYIKEMEEYKKGKKIMEEITESLESIKNLEY